MKHEPHCDADIPGSPGCICSYPEPRTLDIRMTYPCPLERCPWRFDESTTAYDAERADRVIRAHLEAHDVGEWVEALQEARREPSQPLDPGHSQRQNDALWQALVDLNADIDVAPEHRIRTARKHIREGLNIPPRDEAPRTPASALGFATCPVNVDGPGGPLDCTLLSGHSGAHRDRSGAAWNA